MSKVFKVDAAALDLTDKATLAKTDEALDAVTSKGEGKMPAYAEAEGPGDRRSHAYIRTLGKPAEKVPRPARVSRRRKPRRPRRFRRPSNAISIIKQKTGGRRRTAVACFYSLKLSVGARTEWKSPCFFPTQNWSSILVCMCEQFCYEKSRDLRRIPRSNWEFQARGERLLIKARFFYLSPCSRRGRSRWGRDGDNDACLPATGRGDGAPW